MVIEGRIKTLDVEHRRVVITTPDAEEMTLTFPAEMIIEVAEPETMGTMGGELTDLQEGFFVEFEVASHNADGSCACASLVCVS